MEGKMTTFKVKTKRVVIICADTNDGDYIYSVDNIPDDDFKRFKKIANIVKSHGNDNNWENSEYGDIPPSEMYKGTLTEDDIEFFEEFLPYGEFGIHTIESIRVLQVIQEEKII